MVEVEKSFIFPKRPHPPQKYNTS
jgi:hypothetical protein